MGEMVELVPDGFAHSALDTIANDGFAQSPWSGKAETRRLLGVARAEAECHEVATCKARPLVVRLPELGAAKHPADFRE